MGREGGGGVALMEEKRNDYRILVWKPEWKRKLEDVGVDVRIIMKRILKEQNCSASTGFVWLRIEINGRLLWAQ
jgi:hypothetical protein